MSNNFEESHNITILLREQLRRNRQTSTIPDNNNDSDNDLNNENEQVSIIRRLITGRMPFTSHGTRITRSSGTNAVNTVLSNSNSHTSISDDFIRRIQEFMPHREFQEIRDVIDRVGSYSNNFQDNLIEHYNELRDSINREEPRTRRYFREDDIAESFDELYYNNSNSLFKNIHDNGNKYNLLLNNGLETDKINNSIIEKIKKDEIILIDNSYINYKDYPLNIEWKDINDSKVYAYEVMEAYGYLGCYVYNKLIKKGYKLKYYRLESEIINLYNNSLKDYIKKKTDLEFTLVKVESILTCFPTLKELYTLLSKLLISEKEIILYKCLIDIYESYIYNILFLIGRTSAIDYLETKFIPTAKYFVYTLEKSILSEGIDKNINAYESLLQKISKKITLKEAYKEFIRYCHINFLSNIKEVKNRIFKTKYDILLKTSGYSIDNFIK